MRHECDGPPPMLAMKAKDPQQVEIVLMSSVLMMIDAKFDSSFFGNLQMHLDKVNSRAEMKPASEQEQLKREVSRLRSELASLSEYKRYLSYKESWFSKVAL